MFEAGAKAKLSHHVWFHYYTCSSCDSLAAPDLLQSDMPMKSFPINVL